MYIYRLNRNKSPLKLLRKVAMSVVRDSRIARSSLRQLSFLVECVAVLLLSSGISVYALVFVLQCACTGQFARRDSSCLLTSTSAGRVSGSCHTTNSHYNTVIVMVPLSMPFSKTCGDGGVVTGTGKGYCWQCLAINRRSECDGRSLSTLELRYSVRILLGWQSSPF